MARKTHVQLVSDLNGEDIPQGEGETVEFALDGIEFAIDLHNEDAADLRDSLADYVAHARKVGTGRAKARATKGSGAGATTDRAQNQAIRTWANQNGYELADRGRIPGHVQEAYHAQAGQRGLAAVG